MTPLEFVQKLEASDNWAEYRTEYVRLQGYLGHPNSEPHYVLRLHIVGRGLTLEQSAILLHDLDAAADFGSMVANLLRDRGSKVSWKTDVPR